jgi:hypothetical protein
LGLDALVLAITSVGLIIERKGEA